MNKYFYMFFTIILSVVFLSCKENEDRQASEVEIIPQEENTTNKADSDGPMPRSYLLAKMREEGDLSSFTEEMGKSGLEEEFKGDEGIFTFFAPSNAAYDKIPAKELNPDGSMVIGENKENLMRYYMIEGEMTVHYLQEKIQASKDGNYEFRTALGEKIWATENGGKIVLTDVLGNKAAIVTSKMEEKYGVYHVIDNVLRPGNLEDKEAKDKK